jgi:hypothetical protein
MAAKIPLGMRPNLPLIANKLGMTHGTLPEPICASIALNKTLSTVAKDVPEREYFDLWATDKLGLGQTDAYQGALKQSSRPALHRGTPWGMLYAEDSSYVRHGAPYWGIRVNFIPNAIVDNPTILNDLSALGNPRALVSALTHELRPLVWAKYTGPGIAIVFEGGYLDSVKQHVRFTDNHLGRSAEVIAAGQVVMVVAAPLSLSLANFSCI